MKLEQQVTSLELSKRLKELGVKQESLFYWDIPFNKIVFGNYGMIKPHDEIISAFTVAELGELLPTDIQLQGETAWFETRKKTTIGSWIVAYDAEEPCICEASETEVDARAKMLIYLLENNLLTNPL